MRSMNGSLQKVRSLPCCLAITIIFFATNLGFSKCSSSFKSIHSVEKDQEIHQSIDEHMKTCNLVDSKDFLYLYDQTINSMTTSLALVPFDENKVLPHEKPEREFNLAGHKFTIKQDWHNLGVAAVVWDSAIVLAEYLVENKDLVEGKNVLELGAGTGLTGLVAAALGGRVIVTEREEALTHLKTSINHNSKSKDWEIFAVALDWTEPIDQAAFPVQDLIIGADIVYIEETFQDLLSTILSLVKSKETLLLLSCKIRYDRDLYFLNLLRDDFEVKEILYDRNRDIKIFSVLRIS